MTIPQMMCMYRAPTTRHIVTLTLISLLLILVQITSVESFKIESKIHPTRWDVPSPLEIHGTLAVAETFNDLSVELSPSLSSGDNIPMALSPNLCYAVLDHSQTVGIVEVQLPDTIALEISIEKDTTLKEFYIRCEDVVFSRPLSVELTTEITQTNFAITNSYTRVIHYIPVDMAQHPTMLHHYQWKSHQEAIVEVKFSFYRPSTMSDVSEFYLDHPLLQVKRITSTHLAPKTSYVEDLQRPYHLLTRDDYAEGIVCSSTNHPTLPSRILFQRGSVADGEVTPVVSLPTTDDGILPDEPYLCTFTIEYPADVIYASMYSMEDNNLLTATIHRKGSEGSYENIPLGVPLHIPYAKTSTTPLGAFVWHSPHHLHDNMMKFEVAIATTSLYYDTANLKIIPSPLTKMSFQFTSAITTPTNLSDWKATIKCRPHNSLQGNEISHDNGFIDVITQKFGGLGQICQITLQSRPEQSRFDVLHSTFVETIFHQGDNVLYNQVMVSIFDAFHIFHHAENNIYLHDTSSINTQILPWKHTAIPLTTYEDINTKTTYIRATMNLQFLLPYPSLLNSALFSLNLVFNRASELLHVSGGSNMFSARLLVHVGSSSYSIMDASVNLTSLNVHSNTFPDGTEDPEYISATTTSFHTSRPFRAPRLSMEHPFDPIILDSAQPIRITVEWMLLDGVTASDVDGVVVYPYLLASIENFTSTFSPQYARITPVRDTPLTGYSYRCVTWDFLVSLYMYGSNDSAPVREDAFFQCPSHIPAGNDQVDPTIWRRVVHARTTATNEPTCFYQLAAVCVTPSPTRKGTYDVHPLADCQSFLGSTHAIPCHLVDSDAPQVLTAITNFAVDLSLPELDETKDYIHKKRSIQLRWMYSGDPRGALTVSIKPLAHGRDDDGQDTRGWITLARDIPAYLSPQIGPQKQWVTVGFPILAREVEKVLIRLSLNGASSVFESREVPHTIEEDPQGGYQTGCNSNANKLFDDITHLCRCRDGITPNIPIGIDNPLVYPLDFTCEPKPPEQVPIDPEKCHSIPEGVASPYFTQHCGYGFSTNKNGKCDECTCFNAWTEGTNDDKNDGKKCKRCRLMDKCVVKHTADITFNQPEYCLVERCLCKPGYSGDKCQYTVMYGTLAYHDVATDEQKASLANASKEKPVIVPRRQITTFQPRVTSNVKTSLGDTPVEAFVQQATQVLSEDRKEVITSIMVALGRLTDADVSPSPFVMATSPSPFTPAADDGSTNSDLGDLHYAWEQLQNNYQDRPVYKDDDYGTLNGGVGSAYDPHCVPNAYTYCPDGKEDDLLPPESQVDEDELKEVYAEPSSTDHTTTYIIIGVVVGVVLLLFIALIVAILYCRKHEKMCFRKRKAKGGAASSKTASHHASSTAGLELTKASSHSATPPSAPPSSTMSTSSYLPTQVAIADPTLPADWIALEDKSTGKVYYSNQVTMESSWDHPSQPKEKPKSAYGW